MSGHSVDGYKKINTLGNQSMQISSFYQTMKMF